MWYLMFQDNIVVKTSKKEFSLDFSTLESGTTTLSQNAYFYRILSICYCVFTRPSFRKAVSNGFWGTLSSILLQSLLRHETQTIFRVPLTCSSIGSCTDDIVAGRNSTWTLCYFATSLQCVRHGTTRYIFLFFDVTLLLRHTGHSTNIPNIIQAALF
jgi:hypothetical protein